MKSSWDPISFNARSCWDEVSEITTNNNAHSTDAKITTHSFQIQLLGVIGVLSVILIIVIPVTFLLSGNKGSTTLIYSTAVTTFTTITTATTTVSPYACGNMTFLNSTDLSGTDIAPTLTLNYTDCCSNCLVTPLCVGFTLVLSGNACYRKSATSSLSAVNLVSARY